MASLADYNSGIMHGAWIDAAREPDEIHADITAMLACSREPNAEEWAIHDYDQFGRWCVGEFASIEQVSGIARGIADHGYAFAAWASAFDGDPETLDPEAFTRAYLGHYVSLIEYVEQMVDDFGYDDSLAILPERLRQYLRFDTAALARDLELSGDITTVEDPGGGMWIFDPGDRT